MYHINTLLQKHYNSVSQAALRMLDYFIVVSRWTIIIHKCKENKADQAL